MPGALSTLQVRGQRARRATRTPSVIAKRADVDRSSRTIRGGAACSPLPTKRPFRKKLFAGLAVAAGVVLLAFETTRPAETSTERWFWIAVAVGLIGLGVAELVSPRARSGPEGQREPGPDASKEQE